MVLLCLCVFSCCITLQGLIQSAFLWGYTATQLLGGSLADKYGGRTVIAAGEGWEGGPATAAAAVCVYWLRWAVWSSHKQSASAAMRGVLSAGHTQRCLASNFSCLPTAHTCVESADLAAADLILCVS